VLYNINAEQTGFYRFPVWARSIYWVSSEAFAVESHFCGFENITWYLICYIGTLTEFQQILCFSPPFFHHLQIVMKYMAPRNHCIVTTTSLHKLLYFYAKSFLIVKRCLDSLASLLKTCLGAKKTLIIGFSNDARMWRPVYRSRPHRKSIKASLFCVYVVEHKICVRISGCVWIRVG